MSFIEANGIALEVNADQIFMPTADFEPHIQKATLIALCSPQNPTGTVFTDTLRDICKLVLTENIRRKGKATVYRVYDQFIKLSFGDKQNISILLV
ncbi:MAG: hypothetical protein IPL31_04460 [Saprospiraceae bacterium]|nr:hypothetical protein [Saprospiraceae bacterium]